MEREARFILLSVLCFVAFFKFVRFLCVPVCLCYRSARFARCARSLAALVQQLCGFLVRVAGAFLFACVIAALVKRLRCFSVLIF